MKGSEVIASQMGVNMDVMIMQNVSSAKFLVVFFFSEEGVQGVVEMRTGERLTSLGAIK